MQLDLALFLSCFPSINYIKTWYLFPASFLWERGNKGELFPTHQESSQYNLLLREMYKPLLYKSSDKAPPKESIINQVVDADENVTMLCSVLKCELTTTSNVRESSFQTNRGHSASLIHLVDRTEDCVKELWGLNGCQNPWPFSPLRFGSTAIKKATDVCPLHVNPALPWETDVWKMTS